MVSPATTWPRGADRHPVAEHEEAGVLREPRRRQGERLLVRVAAAEDLDVDPVGGPQVVEVGHPAHLEVGRHVEVGYAAGQVEGEHGEGLGQLGASLAEPRLEVGWPGRVAELEEVHGLPAEAVRGVEDVVDELVGRPVAVPAQGHGRVGEVLRVGDQQELVGVDGPGLVRDTRSRRPPRRARARGPAHASSSFIEPERNPFSSTTTSSKPAARTAATTLGVPARRRAAAARGRPRPRRGRRGRGPAGCARPSPRAGRGPPPRRAPRGPAGAASPRRRTPPCEERHAAAGLSHVGSPQRREASRTWALVSPASRSGATAPRSSAARMPGRKPATASSALVPVATVADAARLRERGEHVDQLGLAEEAAVAAVGAVALALHLVGLGREQLDAETGRRSRGPGRARPAGSEWL